MRFLKAVLDTDDENDFTELSDGTSVDSEEPDDEFDVVPDLCNIDSLLINDVSNNLLLSYTLRMNVFYISTFKLLYCLNRGASN